MMTWSARSRRAAQGCAYVARTRNAAVTGQTPVFALWEADSRPHGNSKRLRLRLVQHAPRRKALSVLEGTEKGLMERKLAEVAAVSNGYGQITSQGSAPPRATQCSGQEPLLLAPALPNSGGPAPAARALRGQPHDPSSVRSLQCASSSLGSAFIAPCAIRLSQSACS